MTIDEIYILLKYIVNKTQGGHLPPARFNDIINMASRELLRSYLPGRLKNGNMYSYEENQMISDDIYPFKFPLPDLQVDSNGRALYPVDYVMCSSIRKTLTKYDDNGNPVYQEAPVSVIDDNRLGSVLTSRIVGPKATKIYACMYNDHIQFWPKDIQTVILTYIREPRKMVWAYTFTNNRPVYNAGTSVQPDWPDMCHDALIIKAAALVGINLREEELIKFSADKQMEAIQ